MNFKEGFADKMLLTVDGGLPARRSHSSQGLSVPWPPRSASAL
jgi:hypothetical protein